MKEIHYIVVGGGGAAAYAYGAALEAFPPEVLKNLKGVAGVSAGCLLALAICLKYSPEEACARLKTLDMKKLEDGGHLPLFQWIRVISEFGRSSGNYLRDFVSKMIREKTGRNDPEKVTFADLKKLGFIDLYVVATQLFLFDGNPTGKQVVFSAPATPNTSVVDVICASCAAPIYFKRMRFKEIGPGNYQSANDGHVFNDGGLLDNILIEHFDKPPFLPEEERPKDPNQKVINTHTLGLVLVNKAQILDTDHQPKIEVIKDWKPFIYGEAVFNSLVDQFTNSKLDKKKNRDRIIRIYREEVGLSDFNINAEQQTRLLNSCTKAIKTYFQAHPEYLDPEHPLENFADKKVAIGTMWENSAPKEIVSVSKPEQSSVQPIATTTPQEANKAKAPESKTWCNIM